MVFLSVGSSRITDVDKLYHNEILVGQYRNQPYNEKDGRLSVDNMLIKDGNLSSFYPFDEKKPKFLHIISYQRSGSSFLGDIFHNTPGEALSYL